jgi:hypothetical protein
LAFWNASNPDPVVLLAPAAGAPAPGVADGGNMGQININDDDDFIDIDQIIMPRVVPPPAPAAANVGPLAPKADENNPL